MYEIPEQTESPCIIVSRREREKVERLNKNLEMP